MAGEIQLTLKYGNYPGLFEWAQCNYKGPFKRQKEVGEAV